MGKLWFLVAKSQPLTIESLEIIWLYAGTQGNGGEPVEVPLASSAEPGESIGLLQAMGSTR